MYFVCKQVSFFFLVCKQHSHFCQNYLLFVLASPLGNTPKISQFFVCLKEIFATPKITGIMQVILRIYIYIYRVKYIIYIFYGQVAIYNVSFRYFRVFSTKARLKKSSQFRSFQFFFLVNRLRLKELSVSGGPA